MEPIALPAVIVGMVFSFLLFKSVIRLLERKIELRSQQQNTSIPDTTITELKNEITQVRQVANEYDMSIQHTLDNIVRRLDLLESQRLNNTTSSRPITPAPPEEQQVFAGQDYEKHAN